jgi:hypothetical protein
MITVIDAILAINSNAKVTCDNENIDTIQWHDGTTPIPKADIEAKQAELQTAYNNNAYQRTRATEYPSIADQLDDIYHNGIDAWKATIKTTKDKYPKG